MTSDGEKVLQALNGFLETRGYSTNGPRIPEELAERLVECFAAGSAEKALAVLLDVPATAAPPSAPSILAPVVSDAISHTEATS